VKRKLTVPLGKSRVASLLSADPGLRQRYTRATGAETTRGPAARDLTSVGRLEPASDDDLVIALEDAVGNRYGKLVNSDGKLVGAALLGYVLEAPGVTAAIKATR
jgi:rubredoxin NAD+ reductase-like protein